MLATICFLCGTFLLAFASQGVINGLANKNMELRDSGFVYLIISFIWIILGVVVF